MSRPLIILIACAALGGGLYFLTLRRGPEPAPGASDPANSASALLAHHPGEPGASLPSDAAGGGQSPAPATPAAPASFPTNPVAPATPFLLGSADTPPAMEPATVLGNMRIAVRQYGSRFGGNPVGTNPEITKALNGDNARQARFLSEDSGLRINARSELVDYWGTPFFFHQLSGAEMEIRSAGPDRVMWSADDLVTK